MEDIVFAGVYSLYGQSDIQGSSLEYNHSIQSDLIEQLSLDNYIQQLQKELSAGELVNFYLHSSL